MLIMQCTDLLIVRNHKPVIPYNEAYKPALVRLGLYQIATMGTMYADAALLTALVERWRPETHTFHFSFGEMTLTLEDVSCLWGLPISGEPVTGISDDDSESNSKMLRELLGIDEDDPIRKKRKSAGRMKTSEYALSLKELRERFSVFPDDPSQADVDR